MATIINASTSAGLIQTADTSGTLQLQSNGVTQQTIDSTGSYGQLARGTAQASTSGTSITFSSIPSWVKRITVIFQGFSTSGTSTPLVQIGSGSATTSGYLGSASFVAASNVTGVVAATAGFPIAGISAANIRHGQMVLANISGNTWVSATAGGFSDAAAVLMGGGSVTLSGVLDRVIITTVNGTDTFRVGSINILYEG